MYIYIYKYLYIFMYVCICIYSCIFTKDISINIHVYITHAHMHILHINSYVILMHLNYRYTRLLPAHDRQQKDYWLIFTRKSLQTIVRTLAERVRAAKRAGVRAEKWRECVGCDLCLLCVEGGWAGGELEERLNAVHFVSQVNCPLLPQSGSCARVCVRVCACKREHVLKRA